MIGFFFWIVPIIIFKVSINSVIKSIKENTNELTKIEELLSKLDNK